MFKKFGIYFFSVILVISISLFFINKESYDNTYGSFIKGPDMKYARQENFEAIKLKDGRVLILGFNHKRYAESEKEALSYVSSLKKKEKERYLNEYHHKPSEMYNPKTNSFQEVEFPKDFYYNSKGLLLNDGRVLFTDVLLYDDSNNISRAFSIYNFESKKIELTLPINNKLIIKNDGTKIDKLSQEEVFIYDIDTLLLKDGNVLVMYHSPILQEDFNNRKIYDSNYLSALYKLAEEKNKIEIFNPKTRVFEFIEHLNLVNVKNNILLDNGDVLIVSSSLQSSLYNPDGKKLEMIDSLNILHSKPLLRKLDNGNILILNGSYEKVNGLASGVQKSEIFDVKDKKFKLIGRMTEVRGGDPFKDFTATKLRNGNILISGGHNSEGGRFLQLFVSPYYNYLKSAEIYDVKKNKFIKISNMYKKRRLHKAVLLDNGDVLILGGVKGRASKSTEIFKPNYSNR